jgi:hypothetical protein
LEALFVAGGGTAACSLVRSAERGVRKTLEDREKRRKREGKGVERKI